MPIHDHECPICGNIEEHISFHEEEFVCQKCKVIMHKNIPNKFSFNFTLSEGVWEKGPDGQEHYKGKGGKKVPVHKNGTPIES